MKNKGFSLIELLVVLTIVSILSAIALPKYNEYKANAFDTRAKSDLRSIALAEEAHFLEKEEYLACSNENCAELPGIQKLSKGVELSINLIENGFTGEARHPKGTGATFKWDSENGGLVS